MSQTVEEAMEAFVHAAESRGRSSATIRAYRYRLGDFLRWCEQEKLARPQDILSEHILRFEASMLARGLAPTSRSAYRGTLVAFFRWLRARRVIASSPFEGLALRALPRALPRTPLAVSEVERVLRAIDVDTPSGLRDRAMIEALYSTGLRRAELVALDVTDVDFERGLVTVRHGKGDKDRIVPIGERALAWLARYLVEVRGFLGAPEAERALFLCVWRQQTRRLEAPGLYQRCKLYARRAGLKRPATPHIFRHTVATTMLENGADIRFIQALLGHEKLNSTAIYARVAVPELRRAHAQSHPAAPAEPVPAAPPPKRLRRPNRKK